MEEIELQRDKNIAYVNEIKRITPCVDCGCISPVNQNVSRSSEDQLIEEYEIDPESVTLQPIKWVDYRVEHLGQNTFEIRIPSSATGFRAAFIEFSFSAPDESMFTVTTEVMISPEERPYEKCSGETCYGYLI